MIKVSAACFATAPLSILLLAATAFAQTAEQAAPSASASKVRIVRLSQIKGAVSMDRADGRGFETAITNMPIVEKSRLQTQTGVAEVEFEDNSSLRIAPNSVVEFPALERLPGGTTVSSVRLLKGMAYVSMVKSPGNEFNLLFGEQTVRLPALSHVRLQMEGTEAKLAVLDGALRVDGPSGEIDVPRKKTVTFSMAESTEPTVTKEVAASDFDSWDHNEAEYHERFAQTSALSGSPYTYGTSDMAYYGAFNDLGSCGTMWQPYFASAGWSPYSNGAWAYYQGAGYSWVSPYPWGWTPYHYGSWSYCQGTGWGWMPGGSWNGLNNMVAGANSPVNLPKAPIKGPRVGESSVLTVSEKPLVRSDVDSSSSFVFRKDSAGLGVPREELGKLQKYSEHANARGSVSTQVYFEASPSGRSEPGHEFAGVGSMHRGSPPAAPSSASAAFSGSSAQSASSSMSAPSAPSASHGGSSGGSHH
ncbi:MAG: DUF6600 domain-containing protein [Terracidiphilus sp.]